MLLVYHKRSAKDIVSVKTEGDKLEQGSGKSAVGVDMQV
jgi:hypothetical protein